MSKRRTESGFTLAEMLVALAIAALSMSVLFKLISADLDRTRQARDEAVAASLLQSLLAGNSASPAPGSTQGSANGYAWRVDIAHDSEAAPNLPVDAVSIAATVSWRDGGRIRSRTLSTVRVVATALPQ